MFTFFKIKMLFFVIKSFIYRTDVAPGTHVNKKFNN